MAVEIELLLVGRDTKKIDMNILGSFSDVVTETNLTVVTPDGITITRNLYNSNFTIPVIPLTRTITAEFLGLSYFIDGVYSFSYSVTYNSDPIETTGFVDILFDNNTMSSWVNLMEEHIAINAITNNIPAVRKRSESRELIQAAREFFNIGRHNDAKIMLEGAMELIKEND